MIPKEGAIETEKHQPDFDSEDGFYRTPWQRYGNAITGTTSVMAFLALWELTVYLGVIDQFFISSPIRIVNAASEMVRSGILWPHIMVSLTEFALGFGLAAALGVPIGMFSGWYDKAFAVLNPFISGLNATPRVALLPLIVIWLGIGIWSKVAIVFLGAVFPIVFNMMTAMRTLDESLLKAARSFGANDSQIFRTLALPSSVPFLISGLRLGAGRGLVGIVIGELYAANIGVGYLIALYGSTFQTSSLFVGILIITSMGIALDVVLRRTEAHFEKWRPQTLN